MNEDAQPTETRSRRGCAGLFFAFLLVISAVWGAGLGFFMWTLDAASSRVAEAVADFRPKVGSKVYAMDGQVVGEFSIQDRQLIRLSEIPLHVQKAFLATEDSLFFEHRGVRPDAIVNSLIYMIQTGNTRGGSTITQQVVRNIEPLEVGTERTYRRKLREALVAMQVEREFTKDEILELYLNQLFLGISAYGVEAAAQQYFGKSCRDLTIGEAALIAGLARAPNRNEPINNPENAVQRRNVVLRQMHGDGFIDDEELAAALAEDLEDSVIRPEEDRPAIEDYSIQGRFRGPYFVDEVRAFVQRKYDTEQVYEDGFEIYTTLDLRLQEAAERILLTALEAFDERRKKALGSRAATEFVPVSGALVCLDNRPGYRGFVRAMVGGRDFTREKFNTATMAQRQPGSSIKPFVWAAAIASGMTPSTIIVDGPFSRVAPGGIIWAPRNFDGGYSGPVPIRYALEKSINIVSVRMAEQIGTPLIRSFLQRCGIPTDVEGLTIALGSGTVRVLDLAVAYSCFANGGMRHDPVLITEIRDRDGVQVYNYRDYVQAEQAMDPKVAYVTMNMLKGACTPGHEIGHYPTGWRTHVINRPRAGKTGTTNNSRDAWFCGFTTAYTTVVWVGYRDNRPLGQGRDFTGGRLAAPIWTDFMMEAHEGLPVEDFETPPGIEYFQVDRRSGTRGGRWREAFVAGTSPPYPRPVEVHEEGEDFVAMDDGTQLPLLEGL